MALPFACLARNLYERLAMTHAQQIQSKLLRMEATALFARIEERMGQTCVHSISDYRAYVYLPMTLSGIPVELYLEREAHIGSVGENRWNYHFEVEGRQHKTDLLAVLDGLRSRGYELTSGSENLDRQMRFSMGLYGACQMSLTVRPDIHSEAIGAALGLLDFLLPLRTETTVTNEEDDFPDLIFGDWQTWK